MSLNVSRRKRTKENFMVECEVMMMETTTFHKGKRKDE